MQVPKVGECTRAVLGPATTLIADLHEIEQGSYRVVLVEDVISFLKAKLGVAPFLGRLILVLMPFVLLFG